MCNRFIQLFLFIYYLLFFFNISRSFFASNKRLERVRSVTAPETGKRRSTDYGACLGEPYVFVQKIPFAVEMLFVSLTHRCHVKPFNLPKGLSKASSILGGSQRNLVIDFMECIPTTGLRPNDRLSWILIFIGGVYNSSLGRYCGRKKVNFEGHFWSFNAQRFKL